MPKPKEKHLLVVSFLEGKSFTKRHKVKFLIEAKFDGEQLATDPVDHDETIEINQELAWELDKKSLHMHKLQRSVIKAVCYAVSDTFKENIGYVVLDIRSAPDGNGKPKWYNLLQPKYPKSKPSIQINLYVEDDQPVQLAESANPLTQKPPLQIKNSSSNASLNSSFNSVIHEQKKKLSVNLIETEGYFQIGKANSSCHTYNLTITIVFARNLIRLIAEHQTTSTTRFFFVYKFLNNQVTTKPFDDIVSCQINGERSSIRLHTSLENLKLFFKQEHDLEISFCSNDRILAKSHLNWKTLLEQWTDPNLVDSLTVDYLLKFESTGPTLPTRHSPLIDINMSPVIGVQVGLVKEPDEQLLQVNVENKENVLKLANELENPIDQMRRSPMPTTSHILSSEQHVVFQSSNTKVSMNEKHKEAVQVGRPASRANENILNEGVSARNYISEDMQLKAAYELQMWKEAREKEFEQQLKKT